MKMWILFYKRMFDFKGICKVKEYFLTILEWILMAIILALVIVYNENLIYFWGIYPLVSIIPFLSLTVRRLNDAQRSKANLLWILIPIFGWFVLFFALISKCRADRDREFDKYHW